MAEREISTSLPVFLTSLIWSDYEATTEGLESNSSDLEDVYHTSTGTQPPTGGGPPPVMGSFVPIIIFVVLMVSTIVNNILVILAYCLNESLRVYFNYFLLSMAIADLAVGLIDMPLSLMLAVLGYWPYGDVACALFAIFDTVLIHISILSVLVICVDRYHSVVNPLKHLRSRGVHRALVLILPVYLMSLLGWGTVVVVLWLVSSNEERPSGGQCFLPLADNLGYRLGFEIALYWVPLVLLISLYGRVVLAMRRRQKNMEIIRRREFPTAPKSTGIRLSELKQRAETKSPSTGEQARGGSANISDHTSYKVKDQTPVVMLEVASGQEQKPDAPCCQDITAPPPPCPSLEAETKDQTDDPLEDTPGLSADMSEDADVRGTHEMATGGNLFQPEIKPNFPEEDRTTIGCKMLVLSEIIVKISPEADANVQEDVNMTPDGTNTDPKVDPNTSEENNTVEERGARDEVLITASEIIVVVDPKSSSQALGERKGKKKNEGCSKGKKKEVPKSTASAVTRSNLKAFRTLSIIFLALLLSWLPWAVLNIIEKVSPDAVPPIIIETGIFWVYLNSALNPLCYAAGNKNFRRAMMNLLRCKRRSVTRK